MSVSLEAIRFQHPDDKVISFDQMANIAHDLRAQDTPVICTMGAFDLIHAGHTGLLRSAFAAIGMKGIVITGLENDASIEHNKGGTRPVNPINDRLEVISSIQYVTYCFAWPNVPDYNNPYDFIDRYKTIGADYIAVAMFDPHLALKHWQAKEAGTKVMELSYRHENSTTAMLRRVGYEE